MREQCKAKGITVGIVGGSDLVKQVEQLGPESTFSLSHFSALQEWDYVFSENGVMAYQNGELFHSQSFAAWTGEERLQRLVNFCLEYIAGLEIPVKR